MKSYLPLGNVGLILVAELPIRLMVGVPALGVIEIAWGVLAVPDFSVMVGVSLPAAPVKNHKMMYFTGTK